MLNILLTGVGGQGTVLAAKVLAQAALEKGWQVRTAETIGMAQRGGNVVSHVRIGNKGEQVHAPLVSRGTADLIIAFEPAEAARVLPYLAPAGTLVFATTAVQPVTAALSKNPYRASDVIANMERALAGTQANLVPVDDAALTKAAVGKGLANRMRAHRCRRPSCRDCGLRQAALRGYEPASHQRGGRGVAPQNPALQATGPQIGPVAGFGGCLRFGLAYNDQYDFGIRHPLLLSRAHRVGWSMALASRPVRLGADLPCFPAAFSGLKRLRTFPHAA